MYQDFAEIYDLLMSNVDYNNWADYYVRLLSVCGIRNGKICECACGTGSLTVPLYRHGFHVTGVDLSREMLWQAAQKARKQGIAIPFVQQDMRQLNLHRPMDAVLATCDGVNYLLTDEDALRFFRAAFNALRPGGVLVFDVSTPYKLQNVLCGNGILAEDTEKITYMWQNRWNERSQTVKMDLCFFVREDDGRYRRMDESQEQRAWSAQSLKTVLSKAGFHMIAFFGDRTLNQPGEKEQRWHIVATRPEEAVEKGNDTNEK